MFDDVVPEGQRDHPALADPQLRAIIDRPEPAALPRITMLAAGLVARHTGVHDGPPGSRGARHAARRPGRRRCRAGPPPGLVDELTTLDGELHERLRQAEIGPVASPAERLLSRMNAVRAVAGAPDPDPARAAWNVCWTAGFTVGRNFGDQFNLVVLDRCRDRATRR